MKEGRDQWLHRPCRLPLISILTVKYREECQLYVRVRERLRIGRPGGAGDGGDGGGGFIGGGDGDGDGDVTAPNAGAGAANGGGGAFSSYARLKEAAVGYRGAHLALLAPPSPLAAWVRKDPALSAFHVAMLS